MKNRLTLPNDSLAASGCASFRSATESMPSAIHNQDRGAHAIEFTAPKAKGARRTLPSARTLSPLRTREPVLNAARAYLEVRA